MRVTTHGVLSVLFPLCLAFGACSGQRDFTFVQMCDTQIGFGGYEEDVARFERAVQLINHMVPDFVVICGDLVNRSDEQSYIDFKRIHAGFKVPSYPAPGNHDVGNVPTIETLELYRQRMGDDYYALDHKGYRFVIVNTQLWKSPVPGESEKHDAWVRRMLADAHAEGKPIFVVGHYGLYVNTPDEPEAYFNLEPALRSELLSMYKRYGVVAVLSGHTHRTVIHDHDGVQLVAGETTSKNFDQRPYGFRVWRVEGDPPFTHEFIPLEPTHDQR